MATAALTGTVTTTLVRVAGIVAGGKTIILTLTGDTWVAAGATFDAQRQAIINGMVSAQSEAHGWNVEVKAKIAVTDVVRTSSTVVTITLDAEAAYTVTAVETITVTIPAAALTGAAQIVASPTFVVTPANVTFYVSTAGNDSNNGLSPDATTANTSKPWLTLGKALVSGSVVLAGDTVYVGPGYYYSAGNHTVLGTISSAATPTLIIGDPTNAKGFKDSSGVLLAAGLPWVTTRTAAEGPDSPIASTNNMFNCTTNDPSGLQFSYLVIEVLQTSASIWNCDLNAGTDNVFSDCILIGFNIINTTNTAATAGRNHIVRRCVIYGLNLLNITSSTAAATANADLNILFTKNLCFGCRPYTNAAAVSASGGNLGGGITYSFNTMVQCATGATVAARVSTTTPITFTGNIMFGSGAQLSAGTTGQIIDGGYNRIFNFSGTAAYSNVTQAGTSFIGVAPNLIQPHLVNWGLEMPRHDALGWSDAAHSGQRFSGATSTTADLRNRTVSPWGGGPSIGCQESGNFSQDTSSAVTGGGVNSLKITGAGELSIFLPIDATSTSVSVDTVSGSYGGTNYPQLIVMPNPAIGISASVTDSAVAATIETLSCSIAPTAAGVVDARLVSRSTSTTSTTNFDTLVVA